MTIADLVRRHGLSPDAGPRLRALLEALAAEPDPHTTIRSGERAIDLHLADSLAALALPAVRDAARIADVGAGAGFPGLPLAVALPHARVDLVESAGRKCAVIARLADAAGLANVRVVHARAEEHAAGDGAGAYDAVTVRAVAPLAVLLEYAAPLLCDRGALVAWKGRRDPDEEEAGARAAAVLGMGAGSVVPVTPFPDAQDRHLHVWWKLSPTPERFPRRPGMAAKRPLG